MQAEQLIRETRLLIQKVADRARPETEEEIPEGFHNNLRWQVGHVLTTQELLLLGLTGNKMNIPDEWKSWFAKGTSPADFNEATPDWEMLISELEPACDRILERLSTMDSSLKLPEPYQTSTGPLLKTVGDVAAFSAIHEAIHLGEMKSYIRMLAR